MLILDLIDLQQNLEMSEGNEMEKASHEFANSILKLSNSDLVRLDLCWEHLSLDKIFATHCSIFQSLIFHR